MSKESEMQTNSDLNIDKDLKKEKEVQRQMSIKKYHINPIDFNCRITLCRKHLLAIKFLKIHEGKLKQRK